MRLKKARPRDVEFIFECLKQLRGDVIFSEQDLENYLTARSYFEPREDGNEILIGWRDGVARGILSCNRFNIPRYLGQGIEVEEVIVAKNQQGLGFGSAMLDALLKRLEQDPIIRRVIVKTDDLDLAGRVYKKYFYESDYRTFIKRINDL